MKNQLAFLFIFVGFFATAQISGTVTNEKNEPVEYTTIFNISKETSSITNVKGVFQLEGNIGDSIRIRHLNYKTGEFKISLPNDNYTLSQKNYNLGEVVVSANYAARLFEKSCENTYNKLKDKNISRGFLRNIRIENNDTTQLIDIDLDIVQRKQKSYNQREKIAPYKVQERIIRDTINTTELKIKSSMFPSFNKVNWSKFQNYFNYFEIEDPEVIKLYFFNKKSFKDSIIHIEVIIQKSDTLLLSIAIIGKNLLKNKKGVTLKMDTNSFTYIKYNYDNDFSYISEFRRGWILTNSVFGRKDLTVLQFFKTYNNGASNLERRPNGHRIFDNVLESNKIKNKYDEEFWERDLYLNITPYDFEYLLNLKLGEE